MSDCGVFVLYNGFCLSQGIDPRAYSFNPNEWRLKWAKEMIELEDDEEGDSGDSSKMREVDGENEIVSGEEEQVEPALSRGISCLHPLQEIF